MKCLSNQFVHIGTPFIELTAGLRAFCMSHPLPHGRLSVLKKVARSLISDAALAATRCTSLRSDIS
ncbi:protein of unknown function [Micropruina glycogenica]|uniref:Uncharacterized protein n=1 Tax=Micropruina glycogenica TaxID=75385 RepID=A0A2N9JEN9_9ACTN|nr:protein of unknown function [Micropruina glycogenica]